MCGYDPFAEYDYQLDKEVATEMGFDTVQELYEYMSLECVNRKIQIRKEAENGRIDQ